MDSKLGYSVKEAARAGGWGLTTMKALISSGEVESIKVGRRRIVPCDALKAFIEDQLEQQREQNRSGLDSSCPA